MPVQTQLLHRALFTKPYKEQPAGAEMANITNRFKKKLLQPPGQEDLEVILQLFAEGRTGILNWMETENNRLVFRSGSIIAIDIDDDNRITDPIEVAKQHRAAGLFYTASHGRKGNRYRLIFQLPKPINNELHFKDIVITIKNDLQSDGVPADQVAINLPIRGGIGYELIDSEMVIDMERIDDTIRARYAEKGKKEIQADLTDAPIPFKELQAASEAIGYIPSGSGEGKKWSAIIYGIRSYVDAGHISENEGETLADIISGGEKPFSAVKSSRSATIGSLIHYAKEAGFKFKRRYVDMKRTEQERFSRQDINIGEDQHIDTNTALQLINQRQRIVVDAPTGSGKTSAFMKAVQELESSKNRNIYVFAAPTRALTEQVAKNHDVPAIFGEDNDKLRDLYFSTVLNGNRILVCTYDKVDFLTNLIRGGHSRNNFILIIDEIHKQATDFHYRQTAIREMMKATKDPRCLSLIALTGTAEAVDKNQFDSIAYVKAGNRKSPCDNFAVYQFDKLKQADSELLEVIRRRSEKVKILVYMQNKAKILEIRDHLRENGIQAEVLDSSRKKEPLYKDIVEGETVPEGIQVILTTSVIADGISIRNNYEWEVMAVCKHDSQLFNPATLKQISNRMRNRYFLFSLFIQENQMPNRPFKLEAAFFDQLQTSQRLADQYNQHPAFSAPLYLQSVAEERNALYLEDGQIKVDRMRVRAEAVTKQERYYMGHRAAFITAVSESIGRDVTKTAVLSEELKHGGDLLEVSSPEEPIEATGLTLDVFKAFQAAEPSPLQENLIEAYKESNPVYHSAFLKRTAKYLTFEGATATLKTVNNKTQIQRLYKQMKCKVDIIHFKHFRRPSVTKDVIQEILNLDDWFSPKEIKHEYQVIAKRRKLNLETIREVAKHMIHMDKKTVKGSRKVKPVDTLTFEQIAKENNLTVEQAKQAVIEMSKEYKKTAQIAVQKEIYG